MAGLSKQNNPEHKFKFQGQEEQKEFGLNWSSFKWRNADLALGRFFSVDPLAEDYYYNSTYAFSENHVVAHVELEGLEKESIHNALKWLNNSYAGDLVREGGKFLHGVANAVAHNNTSVTTPNGKTHSLVKLDTPDSKAESIGQKTGHVISFLQGVVEAVVGTGAEGAGIVASGTGVGVVVAVAGDVVRVHGANTAKNSLGNLFGDNNGRVYAHKKKDNQGDATSRKGGGKNAAHANKKRKEAAMKKYNQFKTEFEKLDATPNKTKEIKTARDKAKKQMARWKKDADNPGESHSNNAKGN